MFSHLDDYVGTYRLVSLTNKASMCVLCTSFSGGIDFPLGTFLNLQGLHKFCLGRQIIGRDHYPSVSISLHGNSGVTILLECGSANSRYSSNYSITVQKKKSVCNHKLWCTCTQLYLKECPRVSCRY